MFEPPIKNSYDTWQPPFNTSYVMSPPQSDPMLVALERIEARLINIEAFLRRFVDDGK